MEDLEGQSIDLSVWLQWYAFDVIAYITFQRRFGFIEQRRDVNGMIAALDFVLQYVRVIGQYPEWHPWLVGNRTLVSLIQKLVPNMPDPLKSFLDVIGHFPPFSKALMSFRSLKRRWIDTIEKKDNKRDEQTS